jgi:hypothetical protein
VRDIGSQAGLDSENAALASGSIGCPESRLELEVSFDSLADLEVFWGSIPTPAHKAWGERLRRLVVDGSPRWEVFRTVPILADSTTTAPGKSNSLALASADDVERYATGGALPPATSETASGLAVVSGAEAAGVVLDWKGDPMKINPGDRMPFRF